MDVEEFMREAIDLAKSARSKGNHPFGAVLVLDDKVVLRAENTVVTNRNNLQHAETNLMNLVAGSNLTEEEKSRAIVYTSTEPCAMCAGAIFWTGIKTVVYGCSCQYLGKVAGDDFLIPCRELFCRSASAPVTTIGPMLEEEANAVHEGFWDKLESK